MMLNAVCMRVNWFYGKYGSLKNHLKADFLENPNGSSIVGDHCYYVEPIFAL